MKIPANANTKYLRKIIADLRVEATGWHQATKKAEDALAAANAKVDRIGDNKPWKLIALAFVAGIVIGWFAG